jgi:uncharacterized protein (DUF885 family)
MTEVSAEKAFNTLLEQYYNAWFRYHPEQAIQVGVSGYEDQLKPYSNDDIGALISLNEKMLSTLEELDFSELSADQQIDYFVLHGAVVTELHDLLENDWRYSRPQDYVPVDAIHQLLIRPVDNLHQAFKHRMKQIPEYLRSAKSYIDKHPEKIPLNWLKGAALQSTAGASFFRDLTSHATVVNKFQNPVRLQPICEQSAIALDEFSRYLEDKQNFVGGDFACGKESFERLLKDLHCLDVNTDDLYRFGENLFNETSQQLKLLAKELRSDGNIEELLASIRHDYPGQDYTKGDTEVLLSAYRDRMKKTFDFVKENQLVSIPKNQALKIVDTPEFMRHEIPFAAYEEPTYKDEEQRGYYYVTPVISEGHMLEHNWTSIDLTCVHEAFPGHHLQFVTANLNPANSLPRLLNPSATMYEGWALYCEDLMQEQGFLDKPEHNFIMLRDRLWRALRVMLDVELHCRGLSIDDAAQKMCTHLGFSIDQAKADISWYTQSPTVPMSYALGWALIRALREEQSKKDDFNLKNFHNKLLSVGSCALPLVIKHVFGDEAWEQAKAKVFN